MNLHRFALVFLLLFTAAFASAQTGTITGKVTDDEGVPLQGATVEVVGTTLKATVDAEGNYTIADVPTGDHTVRASTYSYRSVDQTVSVTAGATATQDFQLQIDLLALEEVVVTGTSTPEKKIESSSAISTLDSEELREAAPRSATEYLRRVPGFTRVESSGGEVNQNLSVRGILGVESVNIEEDGMPVYPTMHIFFMNADNLIRPDANLQEIEVLRGGTSPIFGSSTTGATVNFINKTGGDELHGIIGGVAGSSALGRVDFNVNGPLSDDWRFSAGGFYRYDHGIRDPDFPGIKGGQIKANVTRLMDNGFFRVSFKHIDDKNQFILPLPFQNRDDPEFVPGFSDTGSMSTREAVDLQVPLPTGDDLTLPLDDGIHTQATWGTASINFSFADTWQFENTAQAMSADHNWNALLPFDVLVASEYGQQTLNGLINSGIVPAGSTFRLLQTNHFDANGNKLLFNTPNGLISPGGLWHVAKPLSSFSDMLTVRKSFSNNNFAFGGYFAYYTQGNQWNFTDILMDVRDNPIFLDMQVIEPNGKVVDVTKNGFRHFLSNYTNGDGSTNTFALFGSDEFKVTDLLRIDVGVRYERNSYFQSAENTSTVDLDGDPTTQYDIELYGNNTFRHLEFDLDDWAYSFGANYQLVPDRWAVYGSFTRGFKLPALDEFLNETTPQEALVGRFEPFHTYMFETGVKYSGPMVGFTGTFFYGKVFNQFGGGGVEIDPVTGLPIFVRRPVPDTHGWGFELEVYTKPFTNFDIRSQATLLDIGAPATSQAGQFYDGFVPAVFDLELGYAIYGDARVFVDFHYVGTRFGDSALTVKLPDYTYVNLGANYKVPDTGFNFGFKVLNLTQSQGLEEGNPRLDPTRGGAANLYLARPILPRRVTGEVSYEW
jgi:outer membrane receptor protein involved in Fe transport